MDIKTRVGDRTTWQWTLLDDGSAADLSSGVSGVKLYMRTGSTNKIDGATVTYTAGGACSYTPTEADVDTAGKFRMMTVVQRTDGTHSKYPSTGFDSVVISDALDE